MLSRTITQPRSQRNPHPDNRQKVIARCARFALLLLPRRCLCSATRAKRCATTMACWCRRVPCACVPFDALAAMFLVSCHDKRGHVVESRARHRASNPRPSRNNDTKFHLDPSLFLYLANSSRVPHFHPQKHKPHHHGVRRHDYVGSDAEPENFKTVNNAL